MGAKKYIFDFFVIFISIISSVGLTEHARTKLHRVETITALKAVGSDLVIDTANFTKVIKNLRKVEPILLAAMNHELQSNDLHKIKLLLESLRVYHGVGVQKYGYHYLSNNIRNPKIHVPGLLPLIGVYHETTSQEGNFGGFNRDYYEIAFENHKKLFEYFPNYLHPDTTIANQTILDGADKFLASLFWKARISLTYRQITSYNLPVYMYAKSFSLKIIKKINEEIKY